VSVQLPLPYIRPVGSKCFAGGLCSTFAVRASKQGTYWNRQLCRASGRPHDRGTASPNPILCSKHEKGKNQARALADSRPKCLTQRTGKWSVATNHFTQTVPICGFGSTCTGGIGPAGCPRPATTPNGRTNLMVWTSIPPPMPSTANCAPLPSAML